MKAEQLEQLSPKELANVIEASKHQPSIGKMIGTVISKKSNDASFIQNLALALQTNHKASLVFMLQAFSEQKLPKKILKKISWGICIPDQPEEKAKKQTSHPAWLNILNALNQNEKTRPMIYERNERLTLARTKSNGIFEWLIKNAPIIFTGKCLLDIDFPRSNSGSYNDQSKNRLDMQMKIINALFDLAKDNDKLERIALEDDEPTMMKENIKGFIYAALEKRLMEVQAESLERKKHLAEQDEKQQQTKLKKCGKDALREEMTEQEELATAHLSQIAMPKAEAEAEEYEADKILTEAMEIYCNIESYFDPGQGRSEKTIINEIMQVIRHSQTEAFQSARSMDLQGQMINEGPDNHLYMLSIGVICVKYNIKKLLDDIISKQVRSQSQANALPQIVTLLASQRGITLDPDAQQAIDEFPQHVAASTAKAAQAAATAAATAASQAADAALRAEQTAEKAAQKAPAIAAKHSAATAAQAAAQAAQGAALAAQAAQAAQQEATRAYFLGIETRAVQVDAYTGRFTETPAEELNLLSCSVNPLYAADPKTDPANVSPATHARI
jgi:hypothetical protein